MKLWGLLAYQNLVDGSRDPVNPPYYSEIGTAGDSLLRGRSGLVRRWLILVFAIMTAMLIAAPSIAQETVTYTYDALGRLIVSSISGGPNNGTQTGTNFDPASNRTNYTVTGTPTPPSFAISNATAVSEGSPLTFTVTKTGTTSSSYSVNYATANGTAASGSDYNATSGTLTFAAGGTSSQTITVTTLTDSVIESPETVLVNLSGQTGGATITTGQGSGTINDVPPPSFAISNATAVSEGSSLTFSVTKTGTTSSSYSVNYATANGTAASGSDYNATSGTLTFAAGGTSSQTITVTTLTDSVIESPETVLVNLSGQTGGATITTGQGSGTINDVPPPPSFAIGNATAVSEGSPLTFTVTKTGTTSSTYSVNYATGGGTATSGIDYSATSGALVFGAGGTSSQTITVPTLTDSVVESPETVLVNLSGQTGGATVTTSQGSGTINDNSSSNLPPVANADTTSFNCSAYQTVNLVANDTDPENNVPLHLVSITGPGSATVTSTTSVTIGENTPGTFTFSYVVADSLGATSTGQLTATVSGLASQCVVF